MTPVLINVLCLVTGYLLGSFPSAYLMGRIRRGIDIRKVDYGIQKPLSIERGG